MQIRDLHSGLVAESWEPRQTPTFLVLLGAFSLAACSSGASLPSTQASGGSANSGGATSGGAPTAPAGGNGQSTAMGGTMSSAGGAAGAPASGAGQGPATGGIANGGIGISMGGAGVTGGVGAMGGAAMGGAGAAGIGAVGGSGAAGSGGTHAFDHCVFGYEPHPTDATMKDGPAEFFPPGKTDPNLVDTTVQPEVIAWMEENAWQAAHVEWHAIRTCNTPGGALGSKVNICSFAQLVPTDQNCQTSGDGYQFLLFHRHMIQALKQLWPKHTEQFEGFDKFPQTAEDVPPQWRSAWKAWSPEALAAGKLADEIDKPENLAKFPDEGVLGFWLQCNVGQQLRNPPNLDISWVGLHFLLHAKWARPGNTRHGVNNTESNIDNYMFWKLHGWIDKVWEKYRRAKGLLDTDQKYKDDLVKQCREMDTEIRIIKEKLKPGDLMPPMPEPMPVETGDFHTKVRPIFESATNLCSGCHAETGANAGLSLGGNLTSKKIVEGLVNKATRGGGQFKLVVPNKPDESWLYLKASGKAAAAGCVASATAQCLTGVMPQEASGRVTVSAAELETLRQWIQDGAKGPP